MPLQAPSTARTPNCRFPNTTTSITRYPCTRPARKPTNSWPIRTRTSTTCRVPAFASSPSTAHGAVRTWPCSNLPRASSPAINRYSTKAKWCATLPTSMTSVEGVVRVIDRPAKPDPSWSGNAPDPATSYAPWRVFNIGNNKSVELMRYIEVLEKCLGKKAKTGSAAHAARRRSRRLCRHRRSGCRCRFQTDTPVETGIANFVNWYRDYYNVT